MESVSRETQMSIAASSIFPGFKFSPSDVELISYYLRKKIDGYEKCVEVIAEIEIYKFEPWDLPAQSVIKSDNEWFFFCARGRKYPHGSQSRRATELGYWKATGRERSVKAGSDVIGTKRTLVFHIGRAPKGERTEWIMHEYCMLGESQDALVVCRLKKNTEFKASRRNSSTLQDGDHAIPLAGIEPEKTLESCSASESDRRPSTDAAESSTRPEESANDDFFADILNDDIINLDEGPFPSCSFQPLAASQTENKTRPNNPTESTASMIVIQGARGREEEEARQGRSCQGEQLTERVTRLDQRAEEIVPRVIKQAMKPVTQKEGRIEVEAVGKDKKSMWRRCLPRMEGGDRRIWNLGFAAMALLSMLAFASWRLCSNHGC